MNNIKEVNCSVYQNIKSKTNSVISFPAIFEAVRTGILNEIDWKPLIHEIRNETDSDKRRELKTQLACLTFGGVFESSRTSNLVSPSGFLIIDLDYVLDLLDVKAKICSYEYTHACFISPSGNGLKIVFRSQILDKTNYKKIIKQIFNFLRAELGVEVDTSKQNINDLCFISFDSEIYVNNNATNWLDNPKYEEQTQPHEITASNITGDKVEKIIRQIEQEGIDITSPYSNWLKIGFAISHEFGEEGRNYFHRISLFNKEYNFEMTDAQYSHCLKSNGEGITIGTFFHLASQTRIGKKRNAEDIDELYFWYLSDNGGYKINIALLFNFLDEAGFKRFIVNEDESIIVLVRNNKLKKVNRQFITNYFMKFIVSLSISDTIKDDLKNTFYKNQNLFSDNNLNTLQPFTGVLKKDTKDKAWLYFRNCIIEVSKAEIKELSYEQLDGFIWESRVINHDFKIAELDEVMKGEFFSFLKDVCSNDNQDLFFERITSLSTILAYLIHDYKDPSNSKCIILMEENDSDEPNGGKGKGILLKAISYVVKVTKEDGKSFSNRSEFSYSLIEHDTKVFFIDDVQDFIRFEMFFSFITEGVGVNKKYKQKLFIPFEQSPKLAITTNYSVTGEGESHERRKVEFELSDYYNIDNTPEQKFGHLLFNDWDYIQWNLFYNQMIYALQIYFEQGLIKSSSINLNRKKLYSMAGEEFINFIDEKLESLLNRKFNKNNLFVDFYEKFPYQKKIQSQRKFTTCLRLYAKTFNLCIVEHKSGSDYSVELRRM